MNQYRLQRFNEYNKYNLRIIIQNSYIDYDESDYKDRAKLLKPINLFAFGDFSEMSDMKVEDDVYVVEIDNYTDATIISGGIVSEINKMTSEQ